MSNGKNKSAELIIDDQDRYSRMRLIGWWEQDKIANARVLVVGAGALGNEVLKNLALLGFGHIVLIDFDTVDETNLTRSVLFRAADAGQSKAEVAARMIRELNPDCDVETIQGNVLTDIGLGLVQEMDVVIGCLDNREARLWVNRMCWKVGTPWIDGGIQEINGVAKVFQPPDGACYECAMTEMDYKLISLRYSCPLLKQEDILQGKVPTAPTIASIIGGIQVQEALKLIHNLPAANGTALVFNGAANRFYQTKYPYREDCLSHEHYEGIHRSPLGYQSTLQELGEWVKTEIGEDVECLQLDRDFLVSLSCFGCNVVKQVGEPRCQVTADRGMCPECQMPMQSQTEFAIEMGSELARRKLSDLGVPPYDIVKLQTAETTLFVLLAEDSKSYRFSSQQTTQTSGS